MDNTTKWIVRITSIGILLGIGFFLFNSQQEKIKYEEERKRINQERARNELNDRRRMAKINAERYCDRDIIYLRYKAMSDEATEMYKKELQRYFRDPKIEKEIRDIAKTTTVKTLEYYQKCVRSKQKDYLR